MTDTVETINNIENFEVQIYTTPEYIASLTEDERKALRNELYQYPADGLKYDFFEKLKEHRLLYFDLSSNEKGSKKYKGALQWNIEELDNLELEPEINVSQLKKLLKPNKDISYEQAESLFNGDPNLLVASMSLIANSYDSVLAEVDSEYMHNRDVKDIYFFRDDFLFTNSEEKIFLTGRTLLRELSNNSPENHNKYIEQLISDLDAVILRFNISLVGAYAKQYSCFIDNEGLIQEGVQEMFKIIDKFNIDRGVKFSTYATWSIKQGIKRYYQNNISEIRIPIHVKEGMMRFDNAKALLRKRYGEEPTFNEIWNYCIENNIKLPKKKKDFKKAIEHRYLLSLDKNFMSIQNPEDDRNLYDYIPSSENSMDDSKKDIENNEYVNQLLANLTERERIIVMMRTGLIPNIVKTNATKYTLEEVGEEFGITQERVRQIEEKAIEKLRTAALK